MSSLSINSTLGELLDNDASKAALEKHLPGVSTDPQIVMGRGLVLKRVHNFSGGLMTNEALEKIDADLKTLG